MAKTTGAKVMARMLDGYGVTHIFHVPAILRRSLAEIEASTKINRVRTHGEKSAAYMADGYARASRKPGICMAQTVGALNLAAGLRDAYLAKSPLIAMTGGREPGTKFRKVYQQVDDVPAFDGVTKFNATVDSVERFPDMIRQAFRTAVSGSPGPVHLQFRGNEGQIDQEEADMEAEVDLAFASVPPFRPEPSIESVKKALAILQAAEKPVIVAGGGARWSMAGPSIVALAEKLQIPVATSHGGKDAIPATHPLSVGVVGTYSRGSANKVVNEADLVFFIGTETGGMTTHFWKVPNLGTRSIQIDIDPEALGRNYMLEAAVQGDAKVSLDKMIALADADTAAKRKGWVEQARRHVGAWYQQYNELLTSDAVPIRPERICAELSKNLPDDAFVVCDTGHSGMWMGGMYDLRTPQQSYIRCAGHLGWAFPAAIGAQCAVPDRPVVCFTGDGGLWYHIGELETMARWNIPAVIVVNDNHSGNQSKHGYDVIYGGKQTEQARELWVFRDIDFAKIAEVIGVQGIRVTKAGEIAPAIEKAIASRRPTVIDIASDLEAEAPFAVVSSTENNKLRTGEKNAR